MCVSQVKRIICGCMCRVTLKYPMLKCQTTCLACKWMCPVTRTCLKFDIRHLTHPFSIHECVIHAHKWAITFTSIMHTVFVTNCNTLQHTATLCICCNTLQHTAAHFVRMEQSFIDYCSHEWGATNEKSRMRSHNSPPNCQLEVSHLIDKAPKYPVEVLLQCVLLLSHAWVSHITHINDSYRTKKSCRSPSSVCLTYESWERLVAWIKEWYGTQ